MDIQSVGWMISAISVGYLICSLARPVIVGRRIHIAVPWLESRVGEEAVVRCGGKRLAPPRWGGLPPAAGGPSSS